MVFNLFTFGEKPISSTKTNQNNGMTMFGSGADGAFSHSSGNTALDQGTIYQYTTFDLTGTATISTTKTTGDPIIVLVQGNLTISSNGTCDFSGKGVDSPTSMTYKIPDSSTVGHVYVESFVSFSNGANGTNQTGGGAAVLAVGRAGNPPMHSTLQRQNPFYKRVNVPLYICSGTKGGDGGLGTSGVVVGGSVGTGSSGGASIIFLVGGTVTISNITFNMTGSVGGNGTAGTGAGDALWQGGGGGGGGSIAILSAGAVTNTGTFTVTGGAGGTGAKLNSPGAGSIGSGGGGASLISPGTDGGSSTSVAVSGGAGATGFSLIAQFL